MPVRLLENAEPALHEPVNSDGGTYTVRDLLQTEFQALETSYIINMLVKENQVF